MRHYEIVFLVHPEQSEHVPELIEACRSKIEADGGKIHRLEDWGMCPLAYPVLRAHKAHYVLMNVECTPAVLHEVDSSFHFNDVVIRNMIIRCDRAITGPSPFMLSLEAAKAARKHSGRGKERNTVREVDTSAKKEPSEDAVAAEGADKSAKKESSEDAVAAEGADKSAKKESSEDAVAAEGADKSAREEPSENAVAAEGADDGPGRNPDEDAAADSDDVPDAEADAGLSPSPAADADEISTDIKKDS